MASGECYIEPELDTKRGPTRYRHPPPSRGSRRPEPELEKTTDSTNEVSWVSENKVIIIVFALILVILVCVLAWVFLKSDKPPPQNQPPPLAHQPNDQAKNLVQNSQNSKIIKDSKDSKNPKNSKNSKDPNNNPKTSKEVSIKEPKDTKKAKAQKNKEKNKEKNSSKNKAKETEEFEEAEETNDRLQNHQEILQTVDDAEMMKYVNIDSTEDSQESDILDEPDNEEDVEDN